MMQLEKVWYIKVPLNADCRGEYRHLYKGARFNKKNIGFQTICFKKNQKTPRPNSKRKLQNIVKG